MATRRLRIPANTIPLQRQRAIREAVQLVAASPSRGDGLPRLTNCTVHIVAPAIARAARKARLARQAKQIGKAKPSAAGGAAVRLNKVRPQTG